MVQMRLYLLVAALCACCGLGSSGVVTTEKPVLIPIPIIAAKESKPELKEAPVVSQELAASTTTLPPSSEAGTTIAAPVPSPPTTTLAPETTRAPETTPAPETTTAPTTTAAPTPAPTPAPAPAPLPPPEQHTWSYQNTTNNETCIVIQFAAQVNVTYPKNDSSLASVIFNVPANASVVGGSCDPTEQIITLAWPVVNSNFTNTMMLTYNKNVITKTYSLKSLELALSRGQFLNASFQSVVVLRHGEAWPTPLTTSYRCMPPTHLNMTGDTVSGAVATLTLTKLQEEAFRTTNGTQFSAARECGGDVPDAVPIAVGCALGGLVLVVLVAYLVGRRRSNARGYLSM